jgi:hypothetical protein
VAHLPHKLFGYESNHLHVSLPVALQQLCGKVTFPCDNGKTIMHSLNQNSCPTLFGTSDAALKDHRGTHAWIISSGEISDINDPDQSISGAGPVNRYDPNLSFSHAELTGLAALVITANLFMDYHNTKTTFHATCDNQGRKVGSFLKYPVYHKLIGNLSNDITVALSWEATAACVNLKHGLSLSKLQCINTNALQQYLTSIPIVKRANTVKLIHGWLPAYPFLVIIY